VMLQKYSPARWRMSSPGPVHDSPRPAGRFRGNAQHAGKAVSPPRRTFPWKRAPRGHAGMTPSVDASRPRLPDRSPPLTACPGRATLRSHFPLEKDTLCSLGLSGDSATG